MAKRPKRVNPLAGIKKRHVVTADAPKPVPPSQAQTKNATGRVLISEYNALKEWVEERGSSVNAVIGILVRLLMEDAELQDKVAEKIATAQEEEKAARVAKLLEDEKVLSKVREILAQAENS